MTQKEQQAFQERLEAASSWMRAAQERLHDNDNTQGPRDALEARLRETEKIHGCEHEGRVLVDQALQAAEHILQTGDEKLRGETNAEVKELKAQWDETSTYIIHCHSRIEWVWLHWSEYLKAREEFEVWLARLAARLGADVELQLGPREKLWQADHQQVLLSDVRGQGPLLERLLDEGAALHGRTGDPSVEPGAQEALQHAYNHVLHSAKERLTLLQKMAEEHQDYLGSVQAFQTWLLVKTQELGDLLEKEDSDENRLQALQALEGSVAREETSLQHVEGAAEAVQGHTSPAGAQQVGQEALDLRQGWLRLRQDLQAAAQGLRSGLDARSQYLERRQRLGRDIAHLQLLLRGLDGQLEEEGSQGPGGADRSEGPDGADRSEGPGGADRSEEQLVGRWKKYTGIRNTVLSEEPQMEHLKAQLKDLFRFSEDSSQLSDEVLALVKEHQSVKCRATRLCSESESSLRQVLQDPLHLYAQWSQGVSQLLEASAEVTDFSHIAMLVQNIERLLKHGAQLRQRLDLTPARADLLAPVFGSRHAEDLGTRLSTAALGRDSLHVQLQQRKSQLQGMLSRTKQFGDAHQGMCSTLSKLRDALAAADVLQPDILAKKSQAQQLGVILKDLEDCEPRMVELQTLVSSSGVNRTQFEKLYAEWKSLCKAGRVRVGESEDSIQDHEGFLQSLLGVEKWLMVMRQTLESYRGPTGGWNLEQRHGEAQGALGEFPEKELLLHRTEAWGQRVLGRTSEEGRVHVRRDLKRLRASWVALQDLSLNLHRLLNSSTEELNSDLWRVGESSSAWPPAGGPLAPSGASRTEEGSDGDATGRSLRPSGEERDLEGVEEGAGGLGAPRYVSAGPAAAMEDDPVLQAEGDPVLQAEGDPVLQAEGDPVLQAEGDPARPLTLGSGASRQRAPAFGAGDDVQDGDGVGKRPHLGWAAELGEGGSGESLDSVRSRLDLIAGVSAGVGAELALCGGSTGTVAVGGGGTNSRQEVVTDGTLEGRRSSGRQTAAAAAGLGQGGGAFTLFRKDGASLQPSAVPPQGAGSTAGASDLWPSNQSLTGGAGEDQSPAQRESRRRDFEAWLLQQNELLSALGTKRTTLGPKQLRTRREKLQGLRASVGWGQELFQLLIQDGPRAGAWEGAGTRGGAGAGAGDPGLPEDSGLEDLRYRWMIYKSKLKEAEDLRLRLNIKGVGATTDEPVKAKRIVKQESGAGRLQRACCVALPLWLLLLALLLLAWLLPFMERASSCSLTNNFAHSFSVMLRYDGPPPT